MPLDHTVDGLRSVELGVTDLGTRERFYRDVWQLSPVARNDSSVYLRGTSAYHHLLGLHLSSRPEVLRLDLTAPTRSSVDRIHGSLREAGLTVLAPPGAIREPSAGYGFTFRDPEGRAIHIIADDHRHSDVQSVPDRPIKITHVVLNSRDVESTSAFYCKHLGFDVIDRTASLTFIRCNDDHHTLAFAHSDRSTLHHIAFELKDIDSVMRGAGRMRAHGFDIDWGVGRHGPGNNVFAYFVGPDDIVIEYTAEVAKVDKNYKVGGPADWAWPPGRTDQWGIAIGPTERLKSAQRRIYFADEVFHPERFTAAASGEP